MLFTNERCNIDKSNRCCVTCRYWSGWREQNGYGMFTYDMRNREGTCMRNPSEGFGGSRVSALETCPDHAGF